MFQQYIQKAKRYLDITLLNLNTKKKDAIIDDFHKLYYDSGLLEKTWRHSKFLGLPIQKCPFDIFIYQDIIYDLKPDLIIETGTAYGGSALFMATICDAMDHGEIVTVDIKKVGEPPEHPRIKYLIGSSIAPEILDSIREEIKRINPKTIMVILDSNHSKEHVLEELKLYNEFVTPGQYLIVEDTNVNGNPVNLGHGPGPMEALIEFQKNNDDFETDRSVEQHFMSFNPKGYLKRK